MSSNLGATLWYVDSIATGSANGTSWANAWTTINAMANSGSVQSGDTVYLSGGPAGTTQTYSTTTFAPNPGQWLLMVNGATYKIGQDSLHNGTAILNGQAGDYMFVQSLSGVTVSGNAGDGLRHFKTTNTVQLGRGDDWTNVTFEYVDFDGGTNGILFNQGQTGNVIQYCRFNLTSQSSNSAISGSTIAGTGYGSTLTIRYNVFILPRDVANTGFGADGITLGGGGQRIYNNTFTSYGIVVASPPGFAGQHQDGWQGSGGSYFEFYNNRCTDLANYGTFPEPFMSGYSHMKIYNNIGVVTYTNNTQFIAVSATDSVPANDVIVANNTADGFNIPYTFRNPLLNPDPGAWTACYIYNNVSVDGGSNVIDPNVTSANNVSVTSGNGPTTFVSYTKHSASNNYHLLVTATALIGTGTNLSAYFTTDADGLARSVPWDIGAYKYGVPLTFTTANITNLIVN